MVSGLSIIERTRSLEVPPRPQLVNERFELSSKLKEGLRARKPNWGFGQLSEAVYYRSYSRIKPDGTQEQWADTVIRVVEGVMSIRKDWYKNYLGKKWDDKKYQIIAAQLAVFMFEMKVLPPGRGLWAMGTDYVFERGSHSLNNCFAGDTEILTSLGVAAIGKLVDQEVEVWTRKGWVKAPIKSFGIQPTQDVVFAPADIGVNGLRKLRSNHRITVQTTPDHRWIMADGTVTTDLKAGDFVPSEVASIPTDGSGYNNGFVHGMVFGDGTKDHFVAKDGGLRFHIRLCGRSKEQAHRFENVTYPESANGDPIAHLKSFENLKQLPSTYEKTQEYLRGFVDGWLEADSHMEPSGSHQLDTQSLSAALWLKRHAASVGYLVTGFHLEKSATNFGDRKNALNRITLTKEPRFWKVESISEREETEVYCPVVPDEHAFTLAAGIYTGNCGFVEVTDSLSDAATWLMDSLMCGVGVGFSTHTARLPKYLPPPVSVDGFPAYQVPDSREGWVESIRVLIDSYAVGGYKVEFDYSAIRPAGLPLKGFGGISSGPDPLIKAHERIRSYLDSYSRGESSQTRLIIDTMNAIGACVVAGNIRRSAEIALGSPFDDEFLNLKNYDLYPERKDIGWMSNNTVVLTDREHFSAMPEIARLVQNNGEPGILNMLNARKYGRIGDRMEDNVTGVNPCVTGETWTLTDEGPRQVKDLVGRPHGSVVNGKVYSTTENGFWSTGIKDIFKIETSEGYSLRLTSEHPVLRVDKLTAKREQTSWTKVKDLKPGDRIKLNNHRGFEGWSGDGNFMEGWLLGELLGDGTFSENSALLDFWEPGAREMAEIALTRIHSTVEGRSDLLGHERKDKSIRIGSVGLNRLAKNYGFGRNKKAITPAMHRASSDFQRGLLRGLFDADGSVQGNHQKGISVRLSQSNEDLLKQAQSMLLRFGIVSTLYLDRRLAGIRSLPDGKGGMADFYCNADHELVISNDNLQQFAGMIGFNDSRKSTKLTKLLDGYIRNPNRERFVVNIDAIVKDGREEVYDCTVPKISSFDANGLMVHNCGEILLESYELCNLVEVFPTRCIDDNEIYAAMKLATFYASTVSLLRSHSSSTNEVVSRNRRIGVSVSGVADWIDSTSVSHVFDVLNVGYEQVVRPTNAQLAKDAGVPASIRVTTVKPSGSISLLAGVSAGMHHPLDGYVLRRMRVAQDSAVADVLKASGVPNEQDSYSDNTEVFEFPLRYGNGKTRSIKKVSIFEQAAVVAMLQRAWADNAVSNTLTVQPHEFDQIERVLALFAPQVKSLSLLPDVTGAYEQMPLEKITKTEFETRKGKIGETDWSGLTGSDGKDSRFCANDNCEI